MGHVQRNAVRTALAVALATTTILAQEGGTELDGGVGESGSFGGAIALHAGRAVIGAPGAGDSPGGAAYVFEEHGGSWLLAAEFAPASAEPEPGYGAAVAIDGDLALIASPGAPDENDAPLVGEVTVAERTPSGWVERTLLTPPVPMTLAAFGTAVAIEPGGQHIAIGAPGVWLPSGVGEVYVYERHPSNEGEWILRDTLTNPSPGLDAFGASLAFDGQRLLVGAPSDDDLAPNAGAAYVFSDAGDVWQLADVLTASDASAGDSFGTAVALAGSTALVSAPGRADYAGAVYVYEGGPFGWSEAQRLESPAPAAGDTLGNSFSTDGVLLAVGAPEGGVPGAAGRVELFRRIDGAWEHADTLPSPGLASGSGYGVQVAMSDNALLVSADGPDDVFVDALPDLFGDVEAISTAIGGAQELLLNVDPELEGLPYLVLGTTAGSAPGFEFDGHGVPLNIDFYTLHTLLHPNTLPLSNGLGTIGAGGRAEATFTVYGGVVPELAGTTFHHAFLVFDAPGGIPGVAHASRAVGVEVVP